MIAVTKWARRFHLFELRGPRAFERPTKEIGAFRESAAVQIDPCPLN
jgi:hypothetical protein